jgi:hypothetical protein
MACPFVGSSLLFQDGAEIFDARGREFFEEIGSGKKGFYWRIEPRRFLCFFHFAKTLLQNPFHGTPIYTKNVVS